MTTDCRSSEFPHQFLRAVHFFERCENRGGIHGCRATLTIVERIIPRKALQVAVENDADEFSGAIHHGAARIAADDVGRADEIERGVWIDRGFVLDPRGHEVERRLIVYFFFPLRWGGWCRGGR